MSKAMRILCSSDIHGEMPVFEAFAKELAKPGYDCGVLAGDLIDELPRLGEAVDYGVVDQTDFLQEYDPSLTIEDLERQAARVRQMLRRADSPVNETLRRKRDVILDMLESAGKPVFFVLGNHDTIEWPSRGACVNVHLRPAPFMGYRFVGYRYTLMELKEREIRRELSQLKRLIDPSTILITHSPPWGVLDLTNHGERIGSRSIGRLVKRRKPLLHVFGHVHEAAGRSGQALNASYFLTEEFYSVEV